RKGGRPDSRPLFGVHRRRRSYLPADQRRAQSSSTRLQTPGRDQGILNRTLVAAAQIGNDHHVLHETGWNGERVSKLIQPAIPDVEEAPHQAVGLTDLPSHEASVISTTEQPVLRPTAHPVEATREGLELRHLHEARLPRTLYTGPADSVTADS